MTKQGWAPGARAPRGYAKGLSSKKQVVQNTQQRFLYEQEVDQLSERA